MLFTENRRKQLVAEACRRVGVKGLTGEISGYYCNVQRDQCPAGVYITAEVTLYDAGGRAAIESIRAYFPYDNRLRCIIHSAA